MTSPNSDNARNVVKYTGQNYQFTPLYTRSRDPTTTDVKDPKNQGYYPYTALWINKTNSNLWALVKIANNLATWILLSGGGSGPITTITGDDGVNVTPTAMGVINLQGLVVANATHPKAVFTESPGANTEKIDIQVAAAIASTDITKVGLAAFNNTEFTVDANGFVGLVGGGSAIEKINVDAFTGPGTNPVVPNAGAITVTGGQVAAGTTANVIQTNSLAANTYTVQIQRSQAVASSTVGDNGVSHYSSADFAVDSNGFVTGNGRTTKWQTITASQTLVKNNGYMCISPGGALSLALPTTASSTIGDMIEVTLDGATSWTVTQAAGQQIRFSGSQTTLGATGTLASTAQGDTIKLVYQASGRWNCISAVGNLTVT